MSRRSDIEQAILDVLGEQPPDVWVARLGGYSRSLHSLVEHLWRERFPDRRNRPPYRNVQRALGRLEDEGRVEHRHGDNDVYYRLVR